MRVSEKTPSLYYPGIISPCCRLLGEQLTPKGAITVRKTLRAEVREMVRTVEGSQPRLERNWLLAMHSVRLGQLCAELEHRGVDVLEDVRNGLAVLWA